MQKNNSKIIPTALDKYFSEETSFKPRKIFTPKNQKFTNENNDLAEKTKNLKGNFPNFSINL